MSRLISKVFVGVVLGAMLVPAQGFSQGRSPTVDGLWQHRNDEGRPEAWFRIEQRTGVYEGRIVRMFPKPGEDPATFRCTKCEGAEKNAPVLGITFIKGMKRSGLKYEEGTILDPRDGSVYSAEMQLSPDGKKLEVRGFVGISLFGKSQIWERLPDTAMDGLEPAAANTGAKGGKPPARQTTPPPRRQAPANP